MSNVMEVRLNADSLETINCGNWDVNGDLSTVPERTEIEKRFQMFYLLKRNQCTLDSAFSVQPGSSKNCKKTAFGHVICHFPFYPFSMEMKPHFVSFA